MFAVYAVRTFVILAMLLEADYVSGPVSVGNVGLRPLYKGINKYDMFQRY
jgi:hypothetical protein